MLRSRIAGALAGAGEARSKSMLCILRTKDGRLMPAVEGKPLKGVGFLYHRRARRQRRGAAQPAGGCRAFRDRARSRARGHELMRRPRGGSADAPRRVPGAILEARLARLEVELGSLIEHVEHDLRLGP